MKKTPTVQLEAEHQFPFYAFFKLSTATNAVTSLWLADLRRRAISMTEAAETLLELGWTGHDGGDEEGFSLDKSATARQIWLEIGPFRHLLGSVMMLWISAERGYTPSVRVTDQGLEADCSPSELAALRITESLGQSSAESP